ncbi:MAG: YdcF family protein, partial [Bdellovibrionota bacterium]
VLAGGKFRIEAALSLFEAGIGDELFIIGAGKKATPYSLTRVNTPELLHKIPEDRFARIQVETESRNTIENAFAVKKLLLQKPDVKNVILITSSYHMRRAQFILENQIPSGVRVIPFTSPNEAIERSNWWHTWLGIQLTVREYMKFLLASFVLPKIGDVDASAS